MAGTIALIVAAGRGVRAGGGVPKQYRPLAGAPVLRRTVDAFLRHRAVDAVRVIIHPDDRALYESAVAGLALLTPVHGGATRQDSARLGLESLVAEAPDRVLIHDAARPLVDAGTIDRVLDALGCHPAAIAAVPVTDSVKRADAADCIVASVDRAALWRAQTPQGFRFAEILRAHRLAASSNGGGDAGDDAAVAEAAGLAVRLVRGAEENLKVTAPEDFDRALRLLYDATERPAVLPPPDFRVGTGFDVHPFASGDSAMLCGVAVPFDKRLAGHSDADVGLHAITDALLGTIGDGDIGSHFPPSDPRWRGADSAMFLAHAHSLVAAAGGTLRHLDITIMCEAPKVGPHRAAMQTRLGDLLSLPVERISVKATTTDGLGFLGRREGVAALATVTVLFC